MKHLKLFAALCCAAALFAACDKTDEPKADTVQKHDVELEWYQKYYDEITVENIQANLDDSTVANIYLKLVNGGDFTNWGDNNFARFRNTLLQPRLALDSTRIFGRGNFQTIPGYIAPEDSLWLVSKGWTVNQTEEDEVEKHDVELHWFQEYYEEITPENIQANLDDPTVANVYLKLVNGGDYTNCDYRGFAAERRGLAARIALDSTRVFGRGNWQTKPGAMPASDSLWFVQKGWTVNQ